MRYRLAAVVTVAVAALAVAGSAFGFDCIRVSSTLQGLQQSTKSGNWLLFNFSSADAIQETFANLGDELTDRRRSVLPTSTRSPASRSTSRSASGSPGQTACLPGTTPTRRWATARASTKLSKRASSRSLAGRRGMRRPRALEPTCCNEGGSLSGPPSLIASVDRAAGTRLRPGRSSHVPVMCLREDHRARSPAPRDTQPRPLHGGVRRPH